MPFPEVSPYTRGRDGISSEAREERQLGSLRRQRIILRLADALVVTDSRLVLRVENVVTTSNLEGDLNGAMCAAGLVFLLSLLPIA